MILDIACTVVGKGIANVWNIGFSKFLKWIYSKDVLRPMANLSKENVKHYIMNVKKFVWGSNGGINVIEYPLREEDIAMVFKKFRRYNKIYNVIVKAFEPYIKPTASGTIANWIFGAKYEEQKRKNVFSI